MQAMCQARQKQVRKGRSMDIVYEDKRIVVAVKPAGVVSVDQPGGMPALLRQTLHTACIRTVHRLDAPVAGLMVFAHGTTVSRRSAAHCQKFSVFPQGFPPWSNVVDLFLV